MGAAALAALVAGCSGAQTHREEEAAERCPAPGASVPFAQVIAQAESFAGCDVSTEVSFVATGQGPAVLTFDTTGETIFRVMPPGQTPTPNALGGTDASFVSIASGAATPLFTLAPGTRLRLRGRIQFATGTNAFGGNSMDTGTYSRLFRARTVEVLAGGGAPTTAATPTTPPVETSPGCAEGHVMTPETQGRCCWPGQSWSDPLDHCTGAPRCPAGFVGEGSSCTRVAVPPAPASSSTPTVGPTAGAETPVFVPPPRRVNANDGTDRVRFRVVGDLYVGLGTAGGLGFALEIPVARPIATLDSEIALGIDVHGLIGSVAPSSSGSQRQTLYIPFFVTASWRFGLGGTFETGARVGFGGQEETAYPSGIGFYGLVGGILNLRLNRGLGLTLTADALLGPAPGIIFGLGFGT